jgi:tungstate transport system permease protein
MDLIWQGLLDALRLLARRDPAVLGIAALSLLVSGAATLLATLVGVPLGTLVAIRRFPGRRLLVSLINTGMGLPPVVVGLALSIMLWRSGPLGPLALIYTPAAMVAAQFIVAMPLAAGLTRTAVALHGGGLLDALRADGAPEWRVGWELVRAARAQVLVAIAAAFGRAISEVGASLMVGGNILNQTRILTTAITLETGKGEFARAIALGLILLAVAFAVNVGLVRGASPLPSRTP